MEDKANKAWTELIQEYQIDNAIKQHGEFIIQAKDIKKYREPRLMAKWDSSESLPTILKKSDINILPVSRSAYVLSNFKLYQPFPENDINTVKYIPYHWNLLISTICPLNPMRSMQCSSLVYLMTS